MRDTGRDLYPDGLEDEIKFGGVDDIGLRFYLAKQLAKMRYGEKVAIPHSVVNHAWPPTGDHDRSFEGSFRAMALAFGGHRPESSYTTEERIMRDLDDSFRVERMYYDREDHWLIERLKSHCPKCRGDGYYDEWDMSKAPMRFDPDIPVEASATVSKVRITCECLPDEKTRRSNQSGITVKEVE